MESLSRQISCSTSLLCYKQLHLSWCLSANTYYLFLVHLFIGNRQEKKRKRGKMFVYFLVFDFIRSLFIKLLVVIFGEWVKTTQFHPSTQQTRSELAAIVRAYSVKISLHIFNSRVFGEDVTVASQTTEYQWPLKTQKLHSLTALTLLQVQKMRRMTFRWCCQWLESIFLMTQSGKCFVCNFIDDEK